jgi:hypothetical protein
MRIAICELEKTNTTLEKRQWHRSADSSRLVEDSRTLLSELLFDKKKKKMSIR